MPNLPARDIIVVHSSDLHVDHDYTARLHGGDGTTGLACVLAAARHNSADLVILALGFDPEDVPTLFDEPDLKVDRWGTIKADEATLVTSIDGVFAAGDIVRGASLVVWAVRDGRVAAEAIGRHLAKTRLSAAAE